MLRIFYVDYLRGSLEKNFCPTDKMNNIAIRLSINANYFL